MKTKKMAIFYMAIVLLLMSNTTVFAQTASSPLKEFSGEIPITPQWTNTNNIWLDLYFDDNQAECSGIIAGVSGTSSITATFKLERKSILGWSLEKSWDKSSNTDTLTFYGADAVSKGTYRLSVTAKVTKDGKTETVSTSVESKF